MAINPIIPVFPDFFIHVHRNVEEELCELAIRNPSVVIPILTGWQPEISFAAIRFWQDAKHLPRLNDPAAMEAAMREHALKVHYRKGIPVYFQTDDEVANDFLALIKKLKAARIIFHDLCQDAYVIRIFEEVTHA